MAMQKRCSVTEYDKTWQCFPGDFVGQARVSVNSVKIGQCVNVGCVDSSTSG